MINFINFKKFRVNEYIQFFVDVVNIFTKNKPVELGLESQLSPLVQVKGIVKPRPAEMWVGVFS